MKVTINLTYGSTEVTIKQKRTSCGVTTYRGVSDMGTWYQFTDKQINKDRITTKEE